MLNQKILAVDVSKDDLHICLLVGGVALYSRSLNDENGHFQILELYHVNKIDLIGFESTGVYSIGLQKYLVNNGVNPYLINPIHISHYRKSLKLQGKTDQSDSYAIAMYLLKNDDLINLSYPIRDFFKPFTSTIVQLDKQTRQLNNLVHSLKYRDSSSFIVEELLKSIDSLKFTRALLFDHTLVLLREQIPEFDLVKNDIKGVGDVLLAFLLPNLYDHFDKFNSKQINAFFGLNPVSFQSGSSIKRRDKLSKRGDKYVLKMLYMASVASVRSNPILRDKYLKQKESGKHSKVALVAVMSHLLRAIVSRLSHHTGRPIKK